MAPLESGSMSPVTVALIAIIAGSGAAIAFQIVKYIVNCVLELKERLFPAPEGGKHARGDKARQGPDTPAGFRTPQRQGAARQQAPPSTPGTGLKSLMKQAAAAKRAAAASDHTPDTPLYLATLSGGAGALTGLAWAPDAGAVAAACEDGAAHVWTLVPGRDVAAPGTKPPPHAAYEARGGVADLAFGPGPQSTLVVATRGDRGAPGILLWRLPDRGRRVAEVAWRRDGVHAVEAEVRALESSAGSRGGWPVIISASSKTDIRVFSGSGEDLGTIDTGGFQNYGAAVSQDGRWIAAATFTNDVKIHEVGFDRIGTFTGLHKAMALKGHAARVLALTFSPDLAHAATVSADGTLRIWDLNVRYALREDPRCMSVSKLPRALDPGAVARLAWGPCGVLALAAGSELAFFDETGGRLLVEIPAAHARPLTALAWAPARLTVLDRPSWVLATAAADGRVRLWRAPDRASAGRRLV